MLVFFLFSSDLFCARASFSGRRYVPRKTWYRAPGFFLRRTKASRKVCLSKAMLSAPRVLQNTLTNHRPLGSELHSGGEIHPIV